VRETREEHVKLDAVEVGLDDGHEGLLDHLGQVKVEKPCFLWEDFRTLQRIIQNIQIDSHFRNNLKTCKGPPS